MKLYTEEQVKETYLFGKFSEFSFNEVLKLFTPIELPSDEEISKNAPTIPKDADDDLIANKIGFVHGAKWMKEQIQKQIQKQLLTDIMQADEKDGLYDDDKSK